MKAATILALINAARAVEDAYYSKSRSSTQTALAWNDLALARNALEAELGTLNITIESAPVAIYPAQCECGHVYIEKYQFKQVTPEGYIGFCWCGFCKTRYNVKPIESATLPSGTSSPELVAVAEERKL